MHAYGGYYLETKLGKFSEFVRNQI